MADQLPVSINSCSCFNQINNSDVDELAERDDSDIAAAIASARRKFAGYVLAGAPCFIALGLLDIKYHIPIVPWFMFLAVAPIALIIGLFLLRRADQFSLDDPKVFFEWLSDKKCFLLDLDDPETEEISKRILPSHKARYRQSCLRLAEIIREAGRTLSEVHYSGPFSDDELRQFVNPEGVSIISFVSNLNTVSRRTSQAADAKIGSLTMAAIKSPAENWWLILHDDNCLQKGINNSVGEIR